MIINQGHPFSYADIWPWANTIEEAKRQKRITVTPDGKVIFEGREWSKQDYIDHVSGLVRGFTEAFVLAEECQIKKACRCRVAPSAPEHSQ